MVAQVATHLRCGGLRPSSVGNEKPRVARLRPQCQRQEFQRARILAHLRQGVSDQASYSQASRPKGDWVARDGRWRGGPRGAARRSACRQKSRRRPRLPVGLKIRLSEAVQLSFLLHQAQTLSERRTNAAVFPPEPASAGQEHAVTRCSSAT